MKTLSLLLIRSLILFLLFSSHAFSEDITIKLNSGSLRMRTQPGFSSSECGNIKNETSVKKLDEKNGWFQISYENKKCWVHGYYTEKYYAGSQKRTFLDQWTPENSESLVASQEQTRPQSSPTTDSEIASDGGSNIIFKSIYTALTPKPLAKVENPNSNEALTRNLSGEDIKLCHFPLAGRKNELDPTRTKNCWRMMSLANEGKISKDAFVYSLKYLKENLGRLTDRSCLRKGSPTGIKNNCQFVVNDLNKRMPGQPNRSPSYFIDLCHAGAGSAGKGLMVSTYINRGTGSQNGSYVDVPGKKTSVIGAFLTDKISAFHPYRVTQAYKNIGGRNCFKGSSNSENCKVLRLELFGAHSSNNSSEAAKPMHVSPYRSSSGCPSINVNDRWIIEKLNKKGPSLVMNYGPKSFHPESSIKSCKIRK